MMTDRNFSKFAQAEPEIQELLSQLVRPYEEVDAEKYGNLMHKIGLHLASSLLREAIHLRDDKDICLVCTVEDADFLASGVLSGLEQAGISPERIHFQCFWNEKIREASLSISPISRQYAENFDTENAVYLVVKSIISGACVVKTNLTRVLSNAKQAEVYVAAPVLFVGAQERLAAEFPTEVSRRFHYVWFATDYKKHEDGNIIPGIGGSIYQRLGLGDEVTKNKYIPDIVKVRRRQKFSLA